MTGTDALENLKCRGPLLAFLMRAGQRQSCIEIIGAAADRLPQNLGGASDVAGP